MITFSFDPQADAAYLKLTKNKIVDTRQVEYGINIDYDKNGNIVGIEILRGLIVKQN